MEVLLSPRKPKIEINIPQSKKEQISIDVGAPHSGAEYPTYNGPTTVIPEAYEMQILQTENTTVKENIMVLPIPYFETSNPQGGITIYIGE